MLELLVFALVAMVAFKWFIAPTIERMAKEQRRDDFLSRAKEAGAFDPVRPTSADDASASSAAASRTREDDSPPAA